jgi:hypothetical protein
MGKWKALRSVRFTQVPCVALWWETKLRVLSFLKEIWRLLTFPFYGEHYLASCCCRGNFPVRWYTTHLSGRVGAFLDGDFPEEGDTSPAPPPISADLTLLDFFLWEACKRRCLSWRNAKCERVLRQNRQSCRMRYWWNACQYLSRNWISSWCVSCR